MGLVGVSFDDVKTLCVVKGVEIYSGYLVLVYGKPLSGKSRFLMSLCGLISINNKDIPIAYVDLSNKESKVASVVSKFNENFEYFLSSGVDKDEVLEFIKSNDYKVFIIDDYHLLFHSDRKYKKFVYDLFSTARKKNSLVVLSSISCYQNGIRVPKGGRTILYSIDCAFLLDFQKSNAFNRVVRVYTRAGSKSEFITALKQIPNESVGFNDFFVDEVIKHGKNE